jgi:DinB superfamily
MQSADRCRFVPSLSVLLSRLGFLASWFSCSLAMAQSGAATPTLKSVLLEQLRGTHNHEEWFVPVNIAIEGQTAEQASWKDETENHSIAQLVNHLIFWNQQYLAKFKGDKPTAFNGDNKETFAGLDKATWEASVKKVDDVLTGWEKAIEEADDAKLAKWASTIAKISTHNAYHTGQIIYIRKMKGNWDSAKGVR